MRNILSPNLYGSDFMRLSEMVHRRFSPIESRRRPLCRACYLAAATPVQTGILVLTTCIFVQGFAPLLRPR